MPEKIEARAVAEELRKFKYMMNHSFIRAGELLHKIKSKKLYKDMGFKSFTEFLADPDYGMAKATAYLYVAIYKFFVADHGYDENALIDIEVIRLRSLLTVLTKIEDLKPEDIQMWIDKARYLGKGDFYSEINDFLGKKPLDIQPASPDEDEVSLAPTAYLRLVRASPCVICEGRPVDAHHFPQTRGAGSVGDKVIPLCRGCHIQFHQDPKEFFWTYRVKIMDWFYNIVGALIENARA